MFKFIIKINTYPLYNIVFLLGDHTVNYLIGAAARQITLLSLKIKIKIKIKI